MPSREVRRIVVVGGVAGGMSFAARARRLDENAQIIVLERGEHVSFANCGLPYFVSGEIQDESSLHVQTPASLTAALKLDVRTSHDVVAIDAVGHSVTVLTPDGTDEVAYDELVLAPGATAILPGIPGVDSPRVQTLRTADDAARLRSAAGHARTTVVLGAGFIGLEAAEALSMRGVDVHLVQAGSHVLSPLEPELTALVEAELRDRGVVVHTNTTAARIVDDASRATVHLADGTQIMTDLIVVAIGVRPATAFAEVAGVATDNGAILVDAHGRTNVPGIWAVGDAVAHQDPVTGMIRPVPLAGPANRDGRLIADAMFADRIGSAPRPQPAPLGTAIVRVFGLAVGKTGLCRDSLERSGIRFETIHLHPQDHAGYFPGATAIHLVVHFAPADAAVPGRIYGAQAVGEKGVDKRLDVIATAMRAGMTVGDLIDLDLSYAPPFGSAKDPVTMAGLIGQNVLDGVTRLWHAWDLPRVSEAALILDVRRDDEVATGMLPGALHIPHTVLRERIDEVRAAAAGRPVRVHCASGVRSYLAHRVLDAAGFDSATLSGGMQTLLAYHGKDILIHENDHRPATA